MNSELAAALEAATQTGIRDAIQLTDWLYQHCYIHHYGRPRPAIRDEDLTAKLQEANRSRNTADHGWQAVELLPNGELAALKRGIIRRFTPGSYLSAERGPSSPPAKDHPVSVYIKKDSLLTQPGNYFVFSEAIGAEPEWSTLYRFYWHIAPEGAPALVEAVTEECNAFQLTFRFKCPRQAASYSRRDAAVLYIAKEHAHLALPVVERIRQRVAPWLRASAPLCTRPLDTGLAFAEDPPGPDSFGMHRCRLIADAILHDNGNLEQCFRDAGISLEKPWLNPGSEDIPWPLQSAPAGPRSTRGGLLDTAARIGARLCRDAIWHNDLCTWTGDEELIHKALPANLYRGAAGVAIFLSRLATPTAEPIFQRTAEAAMRYALSVAPDGFLTGLYSGKPGILLAAAEILHHDDESQFLDACRPHPGHLDLMSGCAGAIAALLSLHRDRRSPALLHQAIENADWLLAQTNPTYHLTGFSHGAAGYAWVFAELHAATQQPRFAQAAQDAIGYERHHFSPTENNWPDFRIDPPRFCSMWCHGAGGIGLSRLRIAELLPDPLFQQECDIAWQALEATRFPNWCLCHGVAGNADILLSAGRRDWALAQAHQGIEQFEATGRPWPCDSTPASETPGLMTGMAGIGYFYLRAAIAETPSVLLWR